LPIGPCHYRLHQELKINCRNGHGMNSLLKNLHLSYLILMIILVSCLPIEQNSNRRLVDKSSLVDDAITPSDISNLNFLQSGAKIYPKTMSVAGNFADVFYLRGAEVKTYLSLASAQNNNHCLTAYFPNQLKWVVLFAHKDSFFNIGQLTTENYFRVNSLDKSTNNALCNQPLLTSTLTSLKIGSSTVYSLEDVCPSCSLSTVSEGLALYTPGAIKITAIDLSYLNFSLTTSASTGDGGFCTESSSCQGLGYDCCLTGLCVNDKSIKSGVDQTSPPFLQALNIVTNNPTKYSDYPNFFNLCDVDINPDPDPPTTNPIDDAIAHLLYMSELYACTTVGTNELSICTSNYTNGSQYKNIAVAMPVDDRNFTLNHAVSATSALDANTITFVSYAGQTLYQNQTVSGGVTLSVGTQNDDVATGQQVTLTQDPQVDPPHDILKIKYKIDGSCEKINSQLARCFKTYVHAQDNSQIDDHSDAAAFNSRRFHLPFYADTSKNIKVEINNIQYFETSNWTLTTGAANFIQFNASETIFADQVIKLTFFVDLTTYPVMVSKQAAIDKINGLCGCPANNVCKLDPVANSSGAIIDFQCIYPNTNQPSTPLSLYAFINAKSAPLRFHTAGNGALKDTPTLADEVIGQEGTAFSYTNNSFFNPNNQSGTIGYHEVYGTLGVSGSKARAPTIVNVVAGKNYEIYGEAGSFSTCLNCGSDYYNLLAKIFPNSFQNNGSGYVPDSTRTNPFSTSSSVSTEFRANDLLFGRACFLPLTMIPWSHNPAATLAGQRQARLNTQHFLFANGYHRDWFGFDYGSLIGSFDGTNWFSIGTQRQIKAKSNKLYLAINAYFSDLTTNNNYKVFIQETIFGSNNQNLVNSDYQSKGAECQKYHDCSTDADCVTQLGWDYTCQNVAELRTFWPVFDVNGNETLGAEQDVSIVSLLQNYQGGNNKCVYRGRGALCHPDYNLQSSTTSYAKTDSFGLNGCLSNYYCQPLKNGIGTPLAKFNTRIARYASSPANQNDSTLVTQPDQDETGLAARIIGRPLRYIGNEAAGTTALDNLDHNNGEGLCLPGKDPTLATLELQHSTVPGANYLGDRVLGLGHTRIGQTAFDNYLSSCPVLDDSGNYVIFDESTNPSALSPSTYKVLAATQNLPSNSLSLFENIAGIELLGTYETSVVTDPIMQANRCLRAPGAICFTDLDCGPNALVQNQVSGIDEDNGVINNYELKFWQEELVCGQAAAKNSASYDLKNNRCCRETGKVITIGSNYNDTDPTDLLDATNNTLFTSKVPGNDTAAGVDLDELLRYSRVSTVLNEMTNSSYPSLTVAALDECTAGSPCTHHESNTPLNNQWKTFSHLAKNTCCTQNWVRNFHEDNGNDHHWQPTRMQSFDKTNFTCLNWVPSAAAFTFSCTDPAPNLCPIRSIPESEAKRYEEFFAQLSLMGVPQISIQSDDTGFTFDTPICPVDPVDGTTNAGLEVIPGTIKKLSDGEPGEFEDVVGTNTERYSANDLENFDSTLKKVFSEDTVACCIPPGETVANNVTDDMCCTGRKFAAQNRCCLEDYTDISLFLNRYVSSIAQDYPDSIFDARTGYIKNIQIVQQIATEKNLCCSGTMEKGTAYANLKIPGLFSANQQVKRFVQSNADEDNINGAADRFDEGQRWSIHLYCVPSSN
jgi:hypothetical protein